MLLLLLVSTLSLQPVAPYCVNNWKAMSKYKKHDRKYDKKCLLEPSQTGVAAGTARNVQGQCRYEEKSKEYYYEITWEPPAPSPTPVSEYLIKILYWSDWMICYRVAPTQHRLIFNETTVLDNWCYFSFSVTPQPIVFTNGVFKDVDRFPALCPVPLELDPLPNVLVHVGSNVSFRASFKQEPSSRPQITWYFSPDKINCQNPRLINETDTNLVLSPDRTLLRIVDVGAGNKGCYVVSAKTVWDGRVHEQRGYVDINITSTSLFYAREEGLLAHYEKPFFAALAGVMVLLTIVLIISIYTRKHHLQRTLQKNIHNHNNHNNRTTTTQVLLRKKLYISHCMDSPTDAKCLANFSEALTAACGMEVVVDVCSTLEVSDMGGMAMWIPAKMAEVDRVVMVVTPRYLAALQSDKMGEDGGAEGDVCKVHSEANYASNIVFSSISQSRNVIVLRKCVKTDDVPNMLKSYRLLEFPSRFEQSNGDFRVLIDVLLEDTSF